MPDTENLQRIVEHLQGISNGSLKEIVSSGQSQEIAAQVTDTLSGGELANVLEGDVEFWVPDAQVTVGHWEGIGTPATSVTDIQKVAPAGPITQYNSNETAIQRGTIKQVYNTTVDEQAGTFSLSSTPKTGSFAANAAYFLGDVNQAVCAASVGIALGKTIDSALYNLNPDFWDANGMSTINPETWSSITYGDDSIGANLFNLVFGIDPATNKGQAYIDENAFAYMAQWLAQQSFFDVSSMVPDTATSISPNVNLPLMVNTLVPLSFTGSWGLHGTLPYGYFQSNSRYPYNCISISLNPTSPIHLYISKWLNNAVAMCVSSVSNFQCGEVSCTIDGNPLGSGILRSASSFTYNGKTVYYYANSYGYSPDTLRNYNQSASQTRPTPNSTFPRDLAPYIAWMMEYMAESESALSGIGTQPNAQTPTNTDAWTTPQNTLDSLKQQYPDIWGDALTYDNLQPDGTVNPQTFVPIPMPTFNPDMSPWSDTQPTYDPATSPTPDPQIDPTVDLDDFPDPYPNPLTRTLTETPNPSPDPVVPQNPVDTGSGTTPVPAIPDGTASALWSVYHPTQQQVNDFGAWLWTDNVITQFVQAMNNPMDGIITLHKIFAMPVDSGNGTIVIGRLDSQVPTAFVTQQYVSVDCGSVSVQEYFGNVFDYVGTQISIYLPFIGIQPLNVDDVMRSTLNVVYKVDLFTGACLATIYVNRDGRNSMLYQFTGVCSVEYPLTGGQHSSIINGFFGLMGAGVAAASVTGPAGFIAAAGASFVSGTNMAKMQNSRSGAFGANAGAMGIKKPYLIISRPQTKVARQDTHYTGYHTNYTDKVSSFTGIVKARQVHVHGINATDNELSQIETLLKDGIII